MNYNTNSNHCTIIPCWHWNINRLMYVDHRHIRCYTYLIIIQYNGHTSKQKLNNSLSLQMLKIFRTDIGQIQWRTSRCLRALFIRRNRLFFIRVFFHNIYSIHFILVDSGLHHSTWPPMRAFIKKFTKLFLNALLLYYYIERSIVGRRIRFIVFEASIFYEHLVRCNIRCTSVFPIETVTTRTLFGQLTRICIRFLKMLLISITQRLEQWCLTYHNL